MERRRPVILPPGQVRTMIRTRKKDAIERWSRTGLDEQKRMQQRALESSAAWESIRRKRR